MHRFPNGFETRAAIELRAVSGRRLAGLAAVYNTPAKIGSFTETIRAGAFRASLAAGHDILALLDHDPTKLLGRSASGTLRLSDTSRGLAFELDVPDTGLGNDLLAMAERGDVGGMSFGFHVTDQAWPKPDTRELRGIDLREISVVQAFPAYSGTEIAIRSRGIAYAAADAAIRRRYVESML